MLFWLAWGSPKHMLIEMTMDLVTKFRVKFAIACPESVILSAPDVHLVHAKPSCHEIPLFA